MLHLNINTTNPTNNPIYRELLAAFPPHIETHDFHAFAFRLGFAPADVAAICNKSLKTVRKWEQADAPAWAYLLLYACAGYFLHKDWRTFRLHDGSLWTGSRITYNSGFKPAELHEYTFYRQYLTDIKRENDRLRKATGDNVQPFPIQRRLAK